MKDCVTYQEMISAMLDGELTSAQQRELEEHLALCPECRAMHAAFLSLSEAIKGESLPVPQGLHHKIMTGVKAVEKKTKRPLLTVLRPYMAAAACLVLIVAAVLLTRDGSLLGGMTKSESDAAMEETRLESTTMAKSAAGTAVKEESKADQTAGAAAPAESVAETTAETEEATEDIAVENAVTDSADVPPAPEASPEPTQEPKLEPTPEPIVFDAVECLLTTTVDDKVIAERLSETDTRVWLDTLILTGDKYADIVDPSLISYEMEITRENGEVYTVYLHYAQGEQLMLSRHKDGSDAIEVKEIRDFTEYAEETEADK